jgi:holo-[acyl-carrier protein] synthase
MIVGIGIDIAEVDRIERAVLRGERFLRRVFTPSEIAYCEAKKNKFQHYAGRFAAKEAAFKALGTGWRGGIAWQDVEVINEASGKPTLSLHNRAKQISQDLGVTTAHLSISHSGNYAVAEVVFEGLKNEG